MFNISPYMVVPLMAVPLTVKSRIAEPLMTESRIKIAEPLMAESLA